MLVVALDLATTTGVAYGWTERNDFPVCESWNLRATDPLLVPGNLGYELRMLFKRIGSPDAMFIEKGMSPGVLASGFAKTNAATIESQILLHGAALGIAGERQVPHVGRYAPKTIRKAVLGQADPPEGEDLKKWVLRSARALGHSALTHDQADSALLWSFGVHNVLKQPPKALRLIG